MREMELGLRKLIVPPAVELADGPLRVWTRLSVRMQEQDQAETLGHVLRCLKGQRLACGALIVASRSQKLSMVQFNFQ